MFHRQFPEAKVSVTSLRRFYLKNKVTFKVIKKGKREMDYRLPENHDQLIEINERI
jgi:hypothetical protein